MSRLCSRSSCSQPAVATLTYDYSEATVVLGPLATQRQPAAYDLCESHANSLTVPHGWQVIRLAIDYRRADPDDEDLEAIANVIRDAAARRRTDNHRPGAGTSRGGGAKTANRGGSTAWVGANGLGVYGRPVSEQTPATSAAQWHLDATQNAPQRGHLRVIPGTGPGAGEAHGPEDNR